MMWLWMGEVAADQQGYRVLATGQKGEMQPPADIAKNYPATMHLRLYGMNANGKVYEIDSALGSNREAADPGGGYHARVRQPGADARRRTAGRVAAARARGLCQCSTAHLRELLERHAAIGGGCRLLRGGVGAGVVHRRAGWAGVREGAGGGDRETGGRRCRTWRRWR